MIFWPDSNAIAQRSIWTPARCSSRANPFPVIAIVITGQATEPLQGQPPAHVV
ncbi:uncharacterized protein TRIVIDRAFT_110657 [Trichoderma virens Gv29-8]|uniref:Uncharacterized protein n=1 Tax=Hypocrea virens (strain Gv29-8 / FGSC 10586) TaxID=413071 RepID=G9MLU3_HYPVG|nr:uncharacterized protein TRIVIDRAFT_110657 [Trichoderma virens Gv29-8]EHK24317.1 hypothetical protein TRIVIDRAFT_110657 [Trichoderma virens Gv29-8]